MTYRFEQGGKAHKHNNTYAALMDAESCLAREREAHTEIIQLDHDINYAGDSGYTGWAQFDDDEIYVVSYIKADTPHLQVKEAGGYDGEFADAPNTHPRLRDRGGPFPQPPSRGVHRGRRWGTRHRTGLDDPE